MDGEVKEENQSKLLEHIEGLKKNLTGLGFHVNNRVRGIGLGVVAFDCWTEKGMVYFEFWYDPGAGGIIGRIGLRDEKTDVALQWLAERGLKRH